MAQSTENLCLWNRYDLSHRESNGLYRQGPDQVNGKAYWKLDRSGHACTGTYYYIFWYETAPDNAWYIGYGTDTFGFNLSPVLAKCMDSTASTPIDCSSKWSFTIPFSSSNIDTNVQIQWDRCPALDCSSITITPNHINECNGTATQTGANEYTVSGNSWVWWFNEPTFQWYCTTEMKVGHTCSTLSTGDGLLNSASAQQWQDLSDGESIVYDDSFGSTGTFTCSGVGTTTTYQPTTPNPTMPKLPTPFPTESPIKPTLEPSLSPTKRPTVKVQFVTDNPQSTESYTFVECVKDKVLFDGGSISIAIDVDNEKMQITLQGPQSVWFGVGFGSTTMSGTYAITVYGTNAIEVNARILGNHIGGSVVDDYTVDGKGDIGSARVVSIIRDWNSNSYSFTDFIECNIQKLSIIWATGFDDNFGYHGEGNRDNDVELVSCSCGDGDSPSTGEPTNSTDDDVLFRDGVVYHDKFWF